MRTKRLTFLALLALGVTAAAATRHANTVDRSTLMDGRTQANVYPSEGPGETAPLERVYDIAPPMVPHDVSEFSIRRGANDCLDCHRDGDEVETGHAATRVPPSHFANAFTGETSGETVVGMRYNCQQCHVPQAIVTGP